LPPAVSFLPPLSLFYLMTPDPVLQYFLSLLAVFVLNETVTEFGVYTNPFPISIIALPSPREFFPQTLSSVLVSKPAPPPFFSPFFFHFLFHISSLGVVVFLRTLTSSLVCPVLCPFPEAGPDPLLSSFSPLFGAGSLGSFLVAGLFVSPFRCPVPHATLNWPFAALRIAFCLSPVFSFFFVFPPFSCVERLVPDFPLFGLSFFFLK